MSEREPRALFGSIAGDTPMALLEADLDFLLQKMGKPEVDIAEMISALHQAQT